MKMSYLILENAYLKDGNPDDAKDIRVEDPSNYRMYAENIDTPDEVWYTEVTSSDNGDQIYVCSCFTIH